MTTRSSRPAELCVSTGGCTSKGRRLAIVLAALCVSGTTTAFGQSRCPAEPLASGLQLPVGITQTDVGNLIVAESGTAVPNTGRLSLVGLDGSRRTLLDGLPSGINDVNEPSGPAGLWMRGRTLYVAVGVGDVGRAGPTPGTTVPNPNPLSSPLFSSILAIHISAHAERETTGFTLSAADHQTLAAGQPVRLSYGGGETMTIERVADFPDYTPNPLPFFQGNVRLSNPFDLVVVADRLYATDGGQNLVWEVELRSGETSVLASFAPIPNPVAPFGPPVLDAVPTGIAHTGDSLLVTLFRGFPFPPGTSVVEQIDPRTGDHAPFISGLKTAIDVIPVSGSAAAAYLVLQHVSGAPGPPPLSGPGVLFRFAAAGAPTVLADCLPRATSMVLDERSANVYVTELSTGRVVSMSLTQ